MRGDRWVLVIAIALLLGAIPYAVFLEWVFR